MTTITTGTHHTNTTRSLYTIETAVNLNVTGVLRGFVSRRLVQQQSWWDQVEVSDDWHHEFAVSPPPTWVRKLHINDQRVKKKCYLVVLTTDQSWCWWYVRMMQSNYTFKKILAYRCASHPRCSHWHNNIIDRLVSTRAWPPLTSSKVTTLSRVRTTHIHTPTQRKDKVNKSWSWHLYFTVDQLGSIHFRFKSNLDELLEDYDGY